MLKRKQNMFSLMHGLKSTDTPVMDFSCTDYESYSSKQIFSEAPSIKVFKFVLKKIRKRST